MGRWCVGRGEAHPMSSLDWWCYCFDCGRRYTDEGRNLPCDCHKPWPRPDVWHPCGSGGSGCDGIGIPDSLLEWSCGFHVDGFGHGHLALDHGDTRPCAGEGEA